ncbi:MAG: hypothetical protein E4G91_04565 [Candidatus Zixiibacteriota bacterium]|nr:MAG: hypothetical protein E4G91_04565 [candidate division Zixibacteria bacterium]
MSSLFADQSLQFIVTSIIAVLAIIVSVILAVRLRSRKQLSYEILSNQPLLTVNEEAKGRVKILYDNTDVLDASLVTFKVANTGNLPIAVSDFVEPLAVELGEGTGCLSAEIVDSDPKNLGASLHDLKEAILITPFLMNAGDSITVKLLLTGQDVRVQVNGRIMGVRSIKEVRRTLDARYFMGVGMMIFAGLFGLLLMRIFQSLWLSLAIFSSLFLASSWVLLSSRVYRSMKTELNRYYYR